MTTISEIARPIESQGRNKETEPLGDKAIELWKLIAPNRHPKPKLPTAVLLFYYDPEKQAPEMSFEQELFDSILKPYWQTKYDVFLAKLAINPNYFDHGRSNEKDPSSFILQIDAPSPPQLPDDRRTTVFGFAEFPKDKLNNLKNHQIDISAESGLYTGELSRIMLGKPENLQITPFMPFTEATDAEAMLPHNIAWRRKFATEILDRLISLANKTPSETRNMIDRKWQERFKRQRI